MVNKATLMSGCLCGLLLILSGCQNGSHDNATTPGDGSRQNSKKNSSAGKKPTNRIKLDLSGLPKSDGKPDFRPQLRFQDVREQSGIDFTYINGQKGQSLMVETTGGGNAWIDYDRDGRLDLYFCQGGDPTREPVAEQPNDNLFRQVASGQFETVIDSVRIRELGYSQGVSAGDFDGDGFDDLYVTNCGRNSLWRNLGDGSFEEVTDAAGVGDGQRWSSTSAWADIDLDGDLDLYVCNYVQYDRFHPHPCQDEKGNPAICHPKHVDAWPDALLINQGDGTFRDEARQRGVFGPGNKALGVAIADFNRDGFPDIYVANDTTGNFLFINDGTAHFKEDARLQGCDVDRSGSFQASMGLGIYDYDSNGYLDIFLTHYEDESNTLYRNNGDIGFEDVTAIVKLYTPTLPWLGFGTVMQDFNNDSHVDIFVAQGHVNNTPLYKGKQRMPAALFSFDGTVFHELTANAGDYFKKKYIGRGASCADYDNDGDWDLVVDHQNDQPALLKNESPGNHYLKFRLIGTTSNRTGYGTQITLKAGDREVYQELVAGTSYVSSNEPALIFGLGDYQGPCNVQVRWPNGKTESFDVARTDQCLTLIER